VGLKTQQGVTPQDVTVLAHRAVSAANRPAAGCPPASSVPKPHSDTPGQPARWQRYRRWRQTPASKTVLAH